jgi:hypothetical protein
VNYEKIIFLLRELLQEKSLRPGVKATVNGLLKQASKAKTLLGTKIAAKIFGTCESVARALQNPSATVGGCIKSIANLRRALTNFRRDEQFEEMFLPVSTSSYVAMPKQRQSKTPSRYRYESSLPEEQVLNQKDEWHRQYFDAIDCLNNALARRFDQDGMHLAAAREDLIISAARGDPVDLRTVKLPPQINFDALQTELPVN